MQDPKGLGLRSKNVEGVRYSKLVSSLIPLITKSLPGFYIQISKDQYSASEVIYVGKSNDLHRRLTENLKHERIAFWAHAYNGVHPEWQAAAEADSPAMWRVYKNHWQ
jgi:predicted GIY-YIG superfamily endonuclease